MRTGNHHQIELDGRRVDYRLVASRSARKLRVRVGINGIEVVQPIDRTDADVMSFLNCNGAWILDQLQRVERLRSIRMPERQLGEIIFRGERTSVRIEEMRTRRRENRVTLVDGEIVVQRSSGSKVPASRSLENWLRREARAEIEKHLATVTARLRQRPWPDLYYGTANEVGKLLLAAKPVVQLAPDYGARHRSSIPGDARGGSSGCSRSLGKILAYCAKPLPRYRAGEAVARGKRPSAHCRSGQNMRGSPTTSNP